MGIFEPDELMSLWDQYTSIESFLQYGTNGLDMQQFVQFIGGTLSEWGADFYLLERLFVISDVNHDGFIDFPELVMLLSGISSF